MKQWLLRNPADSKSETEIITMYQRTGRPDPGLISTANSVKSEIQDLMQSGQYYCTNELANELTRINNAVDHLKLDGNIMSTSDSFKRFYDPRNSVPEGVSKYILYHCHFIEA